jgi:hypothetical protein
MKVPEIRSTPAQKAKATKKSAATGGPSFSDHLSKVSPSGGETESAKDVAGVSGVSSILAVQEVQNDTEDRTRREMIRYGEDILDKLEELRRDLLIGAIPKERLANMAQTLRSRKATVTDPRLLQLINDIELRAEVELAKWSRTI